MPISCVYCGRSHADPAEVRRCWEAGRSGNGDRQTGRQLEHGATGGPGRAQRTDRRVDVRARRGPRRLGRHVVVLPGAAAPSDWSDVERLVVDPAADPGPSIDRLRRAAATGTSVVVELLGGAEGVGGPDDPPSSVDARDPYEVGVGFLVADDELHHLLWSNSIDHRDPSAPRWWVVDEAVRLGAEVGGAGDVRLPDGTEVWLDAGPVRHVDPVDGVAVVHAVTIEHGHLAVPGPNRTSADLAADQLAAVTHAGGAARIIAPAGSGKTRVLTERARHLVDSWRLPASAVTLVAFNKRAQEEIRHRTSDLSALQVRTLNSIALAIVNGTPPYAPRPVQWRTIDEAEVRRILGRLVETPRKLNVDPIAPWIDALSLVRLGLVDPATAELRYGGDVDGLTDVYPKFLAALERDRVVDFDGQIHRALGVLLTDPRARRAAQRANRVLLVDEFQDLTPAHLLLVRLLAAPGGAVFGVGDDDQTIYGYNGADPAWLIDFASWFPTAGDHPLEVNYRCPAGIVDAVDRLLRHNRRRVAKLIRSASTETGGISTAIGPDPVGATRAAVAAALAAGVVPRDVAVLGRVNATLVPVQVGLRLDGIPVTGGVGLEFVERTAIRAALAWLRLASGAPFEPDDLGEALRRPSRGLHPRVRDWVAEQRDVDGLRRLAGRLTNDRDASKVEDFADAVSELQTLHRSGRPTHVLVEELLGGLGLGGAVATLDRTRTGMNRSAQGDDLTALGHLARLHDDPTTFEHWLRRHLAEGRSDDGVVLSTVHRVKGQEWPHVVVHLADRDQFPHRLADDDEEERRIFHVAITRASQHVTIVAERPSPFIAELSTEPPPVDGVAPKPPASTVAAPSSVDRGRADHPMLDRRSVLAAPGLTIVDQGQEWVVETLVDGGALAGRNGAVRTFRFGSSVTTLGRQRGVLSAPPLGTDPASIRVFDRLRSFRERARAGRPAYTVFGDKTLVAIAEALPADHAALAALPGIGPAKLDQYGDDVLDLVRASLD